MARWNKMARKRPKAIRPSEDEMMEIDGTILMSYIDGELDAQTAREVEDALAGSAALRAKAVAFKDSAALVRAAYGHILHEPVPGELRDVVLSGLARKSSRPFAWRRSKAMLMAASLAFVMLGFGAGSYVTTILPFSLESGLHRPDARLAPGRAAVIQKALENNASGTTVSWDGGNAGSRGSIELIRTFRNKQGRYCREFKETLAAGDGPDTAYEVACRLPQGGWIPQYRLIWLDNRRKYS
jgi:surface antigen